MCYSRFCVFILLFIVNVPCCIGNKKVGGDSLLSMIRERGDVFSVMETIDLKSIDYKDVQSNDSLRSVLTNLLDIKQYKNYRYLSYHKPLHERWFEYWFLDQPKDFTLKLKNDSSLYKAVKDSVMCKYKDLIIFDDDFLPDYCIYPFKWIKWREAYLILLKQWEEGNQSYLFKDLLMRYHCPNIWNLYIKEYLPKEIEKKAKRSDYGLIFVFDKTSCVNFRYEIFKRNSLCAYDIDVFLELLRENKMKGKIYYCSQIEGDKEFICPFNIGLLQSVDLIRNELMKSDNLVVKNIINKLFLDDVDPTEDCMEKCPLYQISKSDMKKISDDIIKNIGEFRKALQPIRNELEKKSESWEKDMPYRDNVR